MDSDIQNRKRETNTDHTEVANKYLNQPTFTCSRSTVEALEKGVDKFKFDDKNTRMMSMTLFWRFYN